MNNEHTLASRSSEVKETRAEKAIRLLTTHAASPFNQKLHEFKAFYPAVAIALKNGMKARPILKILADGGLKLYPGLFEKLVEAMKAEAECPRCTYCRQVIAHPDDAPASGPSTSDTDVAENA